MINKTYINGLLCCSVGFYSLPVFSHDEPKTATGTVSIVGNNTGGKIYILDEAAQKLFDFLPKGCAAETIVVRFGEGLSCTKNIEKNNYSCLIGYDAKGIYSLFQTSDNCPTEF